MWLGECFQSPNSLQVNLTFFFVVVVVFPQMCLQGLRFSQECLASLGPLQSFLNISRFVHVPGLVDDKG